MNSTGPTPKVETAPSLDVVFNPRLTTAYWEVSCCEAHRVLRIRRTAQPIPDAAHMLASWAPIYDLAQTLPLASWALCLDMRLAPPSHDPSVEQALRQSRARLSSQTTRFAAILKSAVGLLHAARLVQPPKGGNIRLFHDDEAGALRFLISGEP